MVSIFFNAIVDDFWYNRNQESEGLENESYFAY